MRRRKAVFAAIIALGMLASACSDVKPVLEADLDRPGPILADRGGPQASDGKVLRIAIAAVVSPEETARTYGDLVGYLERRLDRPVEVIQKRTYSEINHLLEEGTAQLGLVCSLAYVIGHDQFGMKLLAAPATSEGVVYFSYLIVPDESGARSLADLRGTTFAFSDPLSNSGHLVPAFELSKLGETPGDFFRRTLFTYSHDNSIRSVAEGLVDGAAVDSLVYNAMIASDRGLAETTRVVARWGPFGMPPLVVSPTVDPALEASLRDLFMSMADDPDGAQILRDLGFERFVEVDDSHYESIREMWRALGGKL